MGSTSNEISLLIMKERVAHLRDCNIWSETSFYQAPVTSTVLVSAITSLSVFLFPWELLPI